MKHKTQRVIAEFQRLGGNFIRRWDLKPTRSWRNAYDEPERQRRKLPFRRHFTWPEICLSAILLVLIFIATWISVVAPWIRVH
jgi:hypothetical protein